MFYAVFMIASNLDHPARHFRLGPYWILHVQGDKLWAAGEDERLFELAALDKSGRWHVRGLEDASGSGVFDSVFLLAPQLVGLYAAEEE
jgi:hypothetical protein